MVTNWVCPNCTEDENQEENNNEVPQPGEDTQYKQTATKETTLKILQLNTDSILSKIEELKEFIKKNNIDIFLIQETKLVRNDKTPKIPGFTTERRDRLQQKGKEKDRGGGLITGIRKTIPYKSVDKLNLRGIGDHITE